MLPETPPPDPASDFGIERTARMNIRDSIAGHGMRLTPQELAYAKDGPVFADEAFADAVSGALSEPIPSRTEKDRGIFERSIAARRAEKAKQQAIAAAALAKVKALTLSIRSMEDALDGLLVAEA